MRFEFSDPAPIPQSEHLVQASGLSFGFGSSLLFRNLDFAIGGGSRIALLGPNGSGKTTLLNLIKGSEAVMRNRHMVIGEFTQHLVEKLDMNDTPISHLQRGMSKFVGSGLKEEDLSPARLWKRLASFGLTGKAPTQKMQTLSGGQKSRVVFAELAFLSPHLLILDEPTNNLDVESIEALILGLKEFKGAVIVVSHNMRLISDVCSEFWVLRGDGTMRVRREVFDKAMIE